QGLNRYRIKFFIFLEDKDFDKNIREGNYRNQYKPASLYARLKALESEFNTVIRPVDKSLMGSEIYNTLRYCVRDILKNKGFMEK
ncbi:ERCC4-type nuclease, partial [Clostridium perfringens]|nr:ERCC4-type nuclease [Clostridium perfringens]